MRCPACGCNDSKVIDSRLSDDARSTKRRRECVACKRKFTTFETIQLAPVFVIKNDGTRQSFDREKIKRGMMRACEKRPVSMAKIDEIADEIELRIYNLPEQEVSSKIIGEMVMEKLKETDEIAYVRFASIYRSFKDLSSFMEELQRLMQERTKEL